MLSKAEFRELIRKRGALVLDGGLATQLEANGHDLNHPLWSGKLLEDDPDAIQKVHLDYYLAGADVAITASYQASTQGLREHHDIDDKAAAELIKRSVQIAQLARNDAYQQGRGADTPDDRLLVVGSVGPYGAYLADGSEYTGSYGTKLTAEEFRRFHNPRIKALVDAGVDLIAIETIPSLAELESIKAMLKADFPDVISWISCTLKDAEHLSDGTDMENILHLMLESKQIVAFGFNCVPMSLLTAALQNVKNQLEHLSQEEKEKIPTTVGEEYGDLPLLCYPNSGERWDAETKTWKGGEPAGVRDLEDRVRYWREEGARLIGGCCRTGPEYVKRVAKVLREREG